MNNFKTYFFLFILTLGSLIQGNSQTNVTAPEEGKAVIYFLRTSGLGAAMNFRFFDQNKYIGKFSGVNYMRYECEPGEHVFWAKAENIDVLMANLEADKIYLVESNAVMGGFSAGVKFKSVDYSDEKQMKRINKLLDKKESKTFTQEELAAGQEKFTKIIQKGLLKVRKKIDKGRNITIITPEMNIIK